MLVQRINQNIYPNRQAPQKKAIAFKNLVGMDIGGSVREASCKEDILDDNHKVLATIKGTVSKRPARTSLDFTTDIAKHLDVEGNIELQIKSIRTLIKSPYLTTKEVIDLGKELENLKTAQEIIKRQSRKDKILKGLAIAMPGGVQDNVALRMANVGEKGLENVDLNQAEAIAKQAGLELSDDFKITAIKDSGATVLGVLDRYANNPKYANELKEGLELVVVHPGGGWADASASIVGDEVIISMNENSHNLIHDFRNLSNGGEIRVGKTGATVGSFIQNFAEALGLNSKEAEILAKTGNARIPTDIEITLDNVKNADAINILQNSGAYTTARKTPINTTLRIAENSSTKVKEALRYAINCFAETTAIRLNDKILEGFRHFAISGPLSLFAVDQTIQKELDPKFYGVKNLEELIWKHLFNHLGIGSAEGETKDDTVNMVKRATGINIINDVSVLDNRPGLLKLLEAEKKFPGSVRMPSLFKTIVPLKIFKHI